MLTPNQDMEHDCDDEVVTRTKAAQKLPLLEHQGRTKSKQTLEPVKATGADKSLLDEGGDDEGTVTTMEQLPRLDKKRTTRSSQQVTICQHFNAK